MDSLPPEILHLIFAKIDHSTAAKVRLTCKKFAEIAAYYLVNSVRFHTSLESLQRLNLLAKHDIFSQTIKNIVYERSLIADIGCVHAYISHFEDERHHAADRPVPPSNTATDRERRLYQRNKAKAEQQILTKYKNYRQLYDAQQVLLQPPNQLLSNLLGDSMPKFTNLVHLEFSPLRRCSHHTSQRFNEEFGVSCVVPMTIDSLYSTLQVKHMLVPKTPISNTLREMELYNLSPKFFSGQFPKERIITVFSYLTQITLLIKLASDDMEDDDNAPEDALHRILSNGVLKDALAGARRLSSLDVGLVIPDVCGIKSSDIFAQNVSWPLLKSLELESVSTTRSDFISMLKRQPKLKIVTVACMDLSAGNWVETISDIRKDLRLDCFLAEGFLQDSTRLFPMSLINEPIYADDFEKITLSDAINSYISDREYADEEDHPLRDELENFADEDYLIDCYGPPPSDMFDSDDDSMLDMFGDDDDLSDISLEDSDTRMSIDGEGDAAVAAATASISELKGFSSPPASDLDSEPENLAE